MSDWGPSHQYRRPPRDRRWAAVVVLHLDRLHREAMSSGPDQPAGMTSSGGAGAGAAPGTRQERHCVVAYGEAFGPHLTEPGRGATRNQGSARGRT